MKPPFAFRLAWREARSSGRRISVYMGAITLGVAALVATNSFRTGVIDSVHAESRTLLGSDLRLHSGRPFPDSIVAVLDSAAAAGIPIARVTGTVSVVLAPNGNTRLTQVRAVTTGYPFHGEVVTSPPGLWPALADGRGRDVLVEPSLLIALDAAVGDSLRIGRSAFNIAGVLEKPPVEIGFQSAIAPRVYIADTWLAGAGLIQFGSIVIYRAYLRIDDPVRLQRFVDLNHDSFNRNLVHFTTAPEEAEELTEGLDWMTRFLGLVGLTALLLGGLGVGSAVHVFVKDRRPQIAVLRCLGATRRTAFVAYLLQAALLGLGGGLLGAILGVAAQGILPRLLGDAIPVTVGFHIYWTPVLTGLAMGLWVAIVFALLPLLGVRRVPPLQALRADFEPDPVRFDPLRVVAWLLIAGSIIALGVIQAPTPLTGLGFSAGLAGATLALRMVAALVTRAARRWFPRRAAFPLRQGVSSLFRPGNQTAAVTVALGFGVFLVACIWVVQHNLLRRIRPPGAEAAPDLVAFDIQTDQRDDVAAVFRDAGAGTPELVPIVTARIVGLKGRPADEILSGPEARNVEPWAIRREYRNTWRDTLTGTERLVAGSWWDDAASIETTGRNTAVDSAGTAAAARAPSTLPAVGTVDTSAAPAAAARISLEQDLAQGLNVGVGDRITWDVQGVRLETVVTSLRSVDWTRFETNFFVVFEPGSIDAAPQTWVTMARVADATARAQIQRTLARRHPNISTLDLALLQRTLTDIIDRVVLAIRFMALFAVAAGTIVLAGALAAGRHQRTREAVLLRTLGATRRVVRRVLFTEYAALGTLAGLTGTLLGLLAGWSLTRFFFELPFHLPAAPLAIVALAVALLAVAIGAAGNRRILDRPPLETLREAG